MTRRLQPEICLLSPVIIFFLGSSVILWYQRPRVIAVRVSVQQRLELVHLREGEITLTYQKCSRKEDHYVSHQNNLINLPLGLSVLWFTRLLRPGDVE